MTSHIDIRDQDGVSGIAEPRQLVAQAVTQLGNAFRRQHQQDAGGSVSQRATDCVFHGGIDDQGCNVPIGIGVATRHVALQTNAYEFGQPRRVALFATPFGERFEHIAQVSQRDAFSQQQSENLCDFLRRDLA